MDTLNTLTRYLEGLGHMVEAASSVADAFAILSRGQCDVLISDVGLGDGDGWELLERVASRGITPPRIAIAMSGYGNEADCTRSRHSGFQCHLVKPFNLEDLDRALAAGAKR